MAFLYGIFIFICGISIGSFLGVCIYRLPRGESIISPRSRCAQCKNAIRWYDNIPLLSFIILRRRCRACGAKIPYRYFFVELISGILFMALFYFYGLSPEFFIYAALFSGLMAVTFIDFEYKEIPDIISIPGIFIGMAASFLYPRLQQSSSNLSALKLSILGALVGGAIIYCLGIAGKIIFRKEAMGGGDVKLLAMIGAFLGWESAILTFFVAPFFGAAFGIYVKMKTGQSEVPYGPFLSLASLVVLFWGNAIINLFLII